MGTWLPFAHITDRWNRKLYSWNEFDSFHCTVDQTTRWFLTNSFGWPMFCADAIMHYGFSDRHPHPKRGFSEGRCGRTALSSCVLPSLSMWRRRELFTCGEPRRSLLSHFSVQKVLVYLYTFRSYLTYTTQSLSRVGIAGIKVGCCSRSWEQQPCVGGGNCSVRYVTFGKNYIGLCERVIVAGRDGADEFLTLTFLQSTDAEKYFASISFQQSYYWCTEVYYQTWDYIAVLPLQCLLHVMRVGGSLSGVRSVRLKDNWEGKTN